MAVCHPWRLNGAYIEVGNVKQLQGNGQGKKKPTAMKEDAASFLPCVCVLSLCSFHLEIIMPKPPKAISGRPTRNPLHSGPISLLFCCPFTPLVLFLFFCLLSIPICKLSSARPSLTQMPITSSRKIILTIHEVF